MIKNWQHLCIFGRLYATYGTFPVTINHDNKDIEVQQNGLTDLAYVDKSTGEVLLMQGEDGFPNYKSEWADEVPDECGYNIA